MVGTMGVAMTTINNDRGLALGVLAIVLAVVGLFTMMTVMAHVLSPGDSFPITAQLNPF
jgi:hypothetical protein